MLFGRARLLNGQSSTPNSNQGCQPALYGTGRLAALAGGGGGGGGLQCERMDVCVGCLETDPF